MEDDYFMLRKGNNELLVKRYQDDFVFNYWFSVEKKEAAIETAYFFEN